MPNPPVDRSTWPPVLRVFGAGLMLFTLALLANLFTYSVTVDNTDLDHQRNFNDGYKIFSLTLPNSIELCGEPVPMEKLDVRERLDRELLVNTYWQSNSILAHKRAARWFPIIEEILRREGVPEDLKYIALIESNLSNVVSPMGATGYWQFMKETAQAHGLRVDSEVDERYNVIKSTEAAARYLRSSYDRYGSWAMAMASYNLGQGGLDKQVARQGVTNYYDLLLPDETSRYVFRALAMKEVMGDPGRYGFHLRKKDLYAPYSVRTLELDAAVPDLAAWAVAQGTTYKVLKLLNPWLRDNRLSDPKGARYQVLLPEADFDVAVGAEE